MKEPSYQPNMAAAIDTLADDLIEAFAATVNRLALVLPTTDRDFKSTVIHLFAAVFEGFGDESMARGGAKDAEPGNDDPKTSVRPAPLRGNSAVQRILARYLEKEVAAARAETATSVLAMVIDDRSRKFSRTEKLAANSLVFSVGMHGLQGGASQTELAKKHRVCRAAFSARVTKNHRKLGVHPSRGSKSPQAVEAYRERATQSWADKHAGNSVSSD